MINDISMLNHDKKMIALVAKSNLPYILMHNQKIAKDKNVIKQIKIDLQMKIDILINKGLNLKKDDCIIFEDSYSGYCSARNTNIYNIPVVITEAIKANGISRLGLTASSVNRTVVSKPI